MKATFRVPYNIEITANCQPLATAFDRPHRSTMRIQPLHDNVLVRRLDGDTLTPGGLHIPQAAQERPIEGKVIAVGPGKRDESGTLHACSVAAGDLIVFSKYSGTEVTVNGEKALMMREADILGKLVELASSPLPS